MLSSLARIVSLFFSFLIFLLFISPAHAWEAVVLRVVDGDTLLVAPKNTTGFDEICIDVRLYGIDAPELHQSGGQDSKTALEKQAHSGGAVEIIPVESDRYDRVVALVMVDGKNLNIKQIRQGYAWVYQKYCRARMCKAWNLLEKEARQAKLGLWAEEKPVPPWEWRTRQQAQH